MTMQLGRLPSTLAQSSWIPHSRFAEAWVKHSPTVPVSLSTTLRLSSSSSLDNKSGHDPASKRSRAVDKDFLISVLGASATRRDAKDYLSRFKPLTSSRHRKPAQTGGTVPYARGVNLGELYSSPRAVAQAPSFIQDQTAEPVPELDLRIHVAIVVLRQPQYLSDDELNGIALTLGQLARLGLPSAVVLDLDEKSTGNVDYQSWHSTISVQADRLVTAIRQTKKSAAQVLDQALSVSTEPQTSTSPGLQLRGNVKVKYSTLLSTALQNGIVTVLPPTAYDQGQQAQRVPADDVVLALARELRGLQLQDTSHEREVPVGRLTTMAATDRTPEFSLDRIIILDPAGGLPASERKDNAHVFVNLAQEYSSIRRNLEESQTTFEPRTDPEGDSTPPLLGETSVSASIGVTRDTKTIATTSAPAWSHLRNLNLLQQALTLLPPASSGLLIRPQNVASAALTSDQRFGVGTRQHRNPLIHNLLTDRPSVSPSLPTGRVQSTPLRTAETASSEPAKAFSHATFFKRGMPVTIIPDPFISPWLPPEVSEATLTFEDPRVDFPRLLHLIEDSFGRKLDVKHYLDRIQKRLAGIIIAGEYEGGAILTWEYPPSADGSHRAAVPYLDKFAVLQRSQGAGGVADVVFNAMVRTCFPGGVVWRSRKNNPVNRWYFERADGTWKIPDTQWTMFWTGDELWSGGSSLNGEQWKKERWKDYVGVCRNIGASWADNKAPD